MTASTSSADVSLVLETANEKPGRRIRMSGVVDAWRHQTRADRILEWLIVSPEEPAPEVRRLFDGLPARFLVRPDLRYYQQKNTGLAEATAPYAALADADALPENDWLERALEAIEHCDQSDARVALVTGRSRYLPGPFAREMAIAHMPNQAERAEDTTHFLAHNVLFRRATVRSLGFFQSGENRLGPDTDLAARLITAGYRLRYDPSLRVTHNSHERLAGLYRTCLLTGYQFGRFAKNTGSSRAGLSRVKDFAGRVRLLLARLRHDRRAVKIPLWRLPLSALFFVAYAATFARGYGLSRRPR